MFLSFFSLLLPQGLLAADELLNAFRARIHWNRGQQTHQMRTLSSSVVLKPMLLSQREHAHALSLLQSWCEQACYDLDDLQLAQGLA